MTKPQCRILCVDDYPDAAEMLAILLSQQQYEVETATNFKEALQLARRNAFDLYVLDHGLPDGTGIELCEKLKEETPGVLFIFYTGETDEAHRQQALETGAAGYVPKPHIEKLIKVVREVLSNRPCASTES
jgi:DNA-binding response OmpR family regulator